MKLLLAIVVLALSSFAQTTAYLRSGPGSTTIVSPGCTNTSPMVCTVASTSGFSLGDEIVVDGVCSSGTNYISSANGLRKVAAIGSGTISLNDTSGNPVAGNGTWCSGANVGSGYPGGIQYLGKVTPYTLVSGVKGWLDGDNGPQTRKWSLSPSNGLTSLVVSGNTATVTTSFAHDLHTGDHVSVYNSGNSSLNRDGISSDYTVTGTTTYTYTFTTSGVGNGDYTNANDNCGPSSGNPNVIGGTDPCLRVSEYAVTTNGWWKFTVGDVTGLYEAGGPLDYRYPVDGGKITGTTAAVVAGMISTVFLVDQANQTYLTEILYELNNAEKMGGSTFPANETANDGGQYGLSSYAGPYGQQIGRAYTVARTYMTSPQRQTFIDKMINDIEDPTPCTKSLAVPQDTLATGTAQAGGSTSITFSASDPAADSYYVNNIVYFIGGDGGPAYGVVTAYNSTTKIATIGGGWTNYVGSPSANSPTTGTAYTIYSSISISSSAFAATATVTGYNTNFTSTVHVGDSVYGLNYWGFTNDSGSNGSWVTAVNSDTSLTVVNSSPLATSTPSIYWLEPKWTSGTCGAYWVQKHWVGTPGAQPISYPLRGGETAGSYGANNAYDLGDSYLTLFLTTAEDDPRAVTDLAKLHGPTWDYLMSAAWTYFTGLSQSGSNYGLGITTICAARIAWTFAHNVSGYPSMDTSGPWTEALSLEKIYSANFDNPYLPVEGGHDIVGLMFGNSISSVGYGSNWATPMLMDHGSAWNPNAASSQYLKYFLTNVLGFYQPGQNPGPNNEPDEQAVKLDPRITLSDFKAQPLQYLFSATSQATCTALVATALCNATYRGDAIYSHSGWTATDTNVLYQARTFIGDHDYIDAGALQAYKVGYLLAPDTEYVSSPSPADILGTTPEFTGASTLANNSIAVANITRWAAANHGAWASPYGDANSRYVYALSDLSGAYVTTYNAVQRAFVHLKKSGTEEIVMQYDYIDSSNSPTQVAVHTHYPQNGQTTSQYGVYYDEGTTTCPGSGGCGSLNTNRAILEQQTGIADAYGDPTPQYNLISHFLVPTGAPNLFFHWDGDTYSGANGDTDRISVCADASSSGACGATGQNGMELLTVHKVATQPDTSLTTTALNPDSHWTGVQTTDKVVLFARGNGTTYSTLTGFTTTHSGTAQYLFAGLAPENYTVTVGGSAVTGSPFTVSAGDNTLYFESTAGAVVVTSSAPACAITTTTLASGVVGVPYSSTLQTANCAAPVTWSVTAGALCNGLALDSGTGVLSGTPSTPQSCGFTVQAANSGSSGATRALVQTVAANGSGAPGSSAMSSGTVTTSGTIRH